MYYYLFVLCVHCTVVQYICIIGNKNNNNNKINNTDVKVAKMRSVGAGGVKNS